MKVCRVFFFCLMLFFLAMQPTQAAEKILLTEGFDDITTLGPSGWAQLNHSEPLGFSNWLQGSLTIPGAVGGHIAANFLNAAIPGTISNWLITPPFQLNGATLSFLTGAASQVTWPDRLEVRLSTNGTSTDIGTTATDVGDFSTLLLSINPTLLQNVYPETWTEYTLPIKKGGVGRVAFRYFVTNTVVNGNYIGIDTVEIKKGFPWSTFLPAITGEASPPPQPIPDMVTGLWEVYLTADSASVEDSPSYFLDLYDENGSITGNVWCDPDPPTVSGNIDGQEVTIYLTYFRYGITFQGTINGLEMNGTYTAGSSLDPTTGTWRATKKGVLTCP